MYNLFSVEVMHGSYTSYDIHFVEIEILSMVLGVRYTYYETWC